MTPERISRLTLAAVLLCEFGSVASLCTFGYPVLGSIVGAGWALVDAVLWWEPEPEPFFDLDSDDEMTADQWAGMLILHSEAVHGCDHTADARAELGMSGPRGEAVP